MEDRGRKMERSDTRTKLLDTAERLFAEKGIHATSLRNIITEAGANLAAVHYHFGSKDALVREVFARRIRPVNEKRIMRLEELEKEGGTPDLEALIRAFVEPAVRVRFDEPQRIRFMLKFMAHIQIDSGQLREQIFDLFEGVAVRFFSSFQKALPDLSHAELFWRFKFMLGVMHTIVAQPPFHRQRFFKEPEPDLEGILAQTIPFLVAGFQAPKTR